MSALLRRTLLGSFGVVGAGLLVATLNSTAQAAPASQQAGVPTACGTSSCCTCTTAKKSSAKKKATVTITQSTQNTATGQYTFIVDIDPNLSGSKSWKYKVQQLTTTNGIEKWQSIGTFRSVGKDETGTHTVGAGTYRVVVYGTSGCKGKVYSARFTEPAAHSTAVAGASTGSGTGASSGSTGSTVTNIYVTNTVPAPVTTATPVQPVSPTNNQTVSGAPTGAAAVFRSPLSAYITWNAPTSNGGSQILGYRVVDLVHGLSCVATAPATSCTVEGLTAGMSYSFTVTAQNSTGWSAPSAPTNSILAITTASAPRSVVAVRLDGGATITWRASSSDGGSAIVSYLVTASTGETCTATDELTCTINGLSNTTAYTFFVQALNGVGLSVASSDSNTLAAVTAPSPVTNLSANAVGTSATVSWTASASNGGLGPVVYHILIGSSEFTTQSTSWTGTLSAGSYSATVWASNPVGSSTRVTSNGFVISN